MRKLFHFSLFLPCFLWAQRPGTGVDQLSLHLDLRLHPEQREVAAQAILEVQTLEPVDSLWLDAVGFRPDEVLVDGILTEPEVLDKGWVIRPRWLAGERHRLEMTYAARPRKGLYFIGFDDPSGRARKQIWTQGQGIDHRHWIPYIDDQRDKLITSVSCTVLPNWKVLSNGKRVVRTTAEGVQWNYRMEHPHSGYLLALVAGEYVIDSARIAGEFTAEQWGYTDEPEAQQASYARSAAMMEWMRGRIGLPLPWGGYAQAPVCDFRHGAMENTDATVFFDLYYSGPGGQLDNPYLPVDAHEFAHQWFGNYVTTSRGRDHWLHEGWATYWQWEAAKEFLGEDQHLEILSNARGHILDLAPDTVPIRNEQAGSIRMYEKAGWVLRQLEAWLGAEVFAEGYRNFLKKNAFGLVELQNLQEAMEAACCCSLDRFFLERLELSGWPVVEMSLEGKDLHIRQQAPARAFNLHLIYGAGGVRTQEVRISSGHEVIPLDQVPDWVLPDPEGLELVEWAGDLPWTERAFREIQSPLTRLLALRRFGASAELLERLVLKDPSGPVRQEAARLLAGTGTPSAKVIRALARDKWKGCRMELAGWATVTGEMEEAVTGLLRDPSPEVALSAFITLCSHNPKRFPQVEQVMLEREENAFAWPVHRWHLRHLLGDGQAIDSLAELCGPAHGYLVRLEAANALIATGQLTPTAAGYLLDGSWNYNPRLASGFRNAIKKLAPNNRSALNKALAERNATFTADQLAAVKSWIQP